MAAPRKILICEDEDAIREFEVINLQRSGYEVVDVSCGEDAIRVFDEQGDSFSVAILDIMMPGIDGFAVCKHIREKNNTLGIIMLSAKSQEMDKVNGLMLGADDYITKPFSPSELVARVDAVYRRVSMSSAKQEPETELRSGPFQLNIRSRSLTRDGQKIDLTQVEFQLMEHFMRNPNVALDRSALLATVWGDSYFGDDKIVDVNVRRLRMKIEIPAERRPGNGKSLWLRGAKGNNLKNVDVEFPLGKLICVTGVSGSGKSTLINDTLQPILSQHFYRSLQEPLPYDSVEGLDYIDKVVNVDQSPLGRTPRSNPATYTGVFSDIRNLFVGLPEAKIRGYKPGRFSFNVTGGRCEACGGNGYKTIEMNFLPDVLVPCEVCHGKRYNRETLEVRYKGKSIADVLDMTINRAVEFFENVPQILNKIKVLQEVGLGYIKLGQPSTTLSGGESQRVKLATELSKRDTGKTMYILDEPTTGLHFEDIRVLMNVLNKLVEKGNTVLVIEHNLDVIKLADYIIDMGPEGGRGGGQVLAAGTPEEVAGSKKGYTPKFIKEELEN